jgi:hypothetical protein
VIFRFDATTLDGGQLTADQSAAVEWLLEHPRALLADDVGRGKTIVTIAYIGQLGHRGLLGGDNASDSVSG